MPGKRPIKLALCKTKRHKSGTKERDCCFQDRCALVTRRTVGNNMVTSGYRGHIMSTSIKHRCRLWAHFGTPIGQGTQITSLWRRLRFDNVRDLNNVDR